MPSTTRVIGNENKVKGLLCVPWDINKVYSEYLTTCKKKQGQKQLKKKFIANDAQKIAASTVNTRQHFKTVSVSLHLSAINKLSPSCTKIPKNLLEQIFVHQRELQL